MSILGKARLTTEQREVVKEVVSRNASFRCAACGKVEKQPKTVSEVMHRCPKDSRMRTLKREET